MASFHVLVAGEDIWDRIIPHSLRTHGLGKLGFRLAEQEAKKRGGKDISFDAMRKDELAVALSLGYTMHKKDESHLKKLLGLDLHKRLPEKKELVNLLQHKDVQYDNWDFGNRVMSMRVSKEL